MGLSPENRNDYREDLSGLLEDFHARTLRMRAVERILDSKDFEIAYLKASEHQKDRLNFILLGPCLESIRDWVASLIEEPLQLCSYRALRKLAQQENVMRYSRMSRDELIRRLEKTLQRRMNERSMGRGIEATG